MCSGLYSCALTCTYELARTFHAFYHSVRVLQSDERDARLRLTAAAKHALANCLRLLDVEAPDRM